jgi:hypothetical protein
VEPGGRLTALYEIDWRVALHCISLSCAAVVTISQWIHRTTDGTDIATRSGDLLEKVEAAQSNPEIN